MPDPLLALPNGGPPGMALSYSRFVADVTTGAVRTVTIDPGPGLLRGHSEQTQRLVDREVAALLTAAETRARDLLTQHIEALNQLTIALLERENITGDQVRALVQPAQTGPATNSAARLSGRRWS